MPQPFPCPTLACKTALDGVLATVTLAITLVEANRPVDLAGLDAAAGRLCAQALDLEPDAGSGLKSDFALLAAKLDDLSEAMRTRL